MNEEREERVWQRIDLLVGIGIPIMLLGVLPLKWALEQVFK